VRCPDESAIARCLARNGQPGCFLISEPGFRDLKARFFPTDRDEDHEIIET
jgi:hypothetical protein